MIVLQFVAVLISCNATPDPRIKEVDGFFESQYQYENFSGNILIAENGKILYEKSLGMSNNKTNQQLNSESMFNIASISKTFTAVSILQLNERGLLNLNDTIDRYFPDFPYDNITIRNLLTHTSGLYRIQSELIRKEIDQKGFSNEEVLEVYKTVHPEAYFQPGTGYQYANTNYILLALIVEDVANTAYDAYINEHIFQKVGMTSTFLKERRIPRALKSRVVTYYRKPQWLSKEEQDINTLKDDLAEKRTFENNYGESAVYTTTRDLLKYHRALQNGTLLNSSSMLKMYTPFKFTNGEDYEILPRSNYAAYSGLSWSISKDDIDGQIVYHAGGFRGGRSFFIRNTEKDQCIIMLTNNDLTNIHTFTAPMRILNKQTYQVDKKSLPKLFSAEYVNNGFDSALRTYKEFENNDNYIQFIDWDFEEIGAELMAKNDYISAISLFQLYTKNYAQDEFSWSLLGDAYYANNDEVKAIENYKKALVVNPEHQHAQDMLNVLTRDLKSID